jgi:hypothetical protein
LLQGHLEPPQAVAAAAAVDVVVVVDGGARLVVVVRRRPVVGLVTGRPQPTLHGTDPEIKDEIK